MSDSPDWTLIARSLLSRVDILADKVGALERTVRGEHTPAIDDLEDRVDAHDKLHAEHAALGARLLKEVPLMRLVVEGVDRKLDALLDHVKALAPVRRE